MSQQKIIRFLALLGIICLVIVGIATVRSCHTPEDPQHFQEDDVTSLLPASAESLYG